MNKRVLITGGAGYIGSHTVRLLLEEGWEVVVIDSLTQGYRQFLPDSACLYTVNLLDTEEVKKVLVETRPLAVIHFAGFIQAEESVTNPAKYYQNNVTGSLSLLQAMLHAGVKHIIFSSSAAVYGEAGEGPIPESAPLKPLNPYGRTKYMVEEILKDLSRSNGIKYVSLRYFNAAGAHPSGEIGEAHNPETHLIPLLLQTAEGKREKFVLHKASGETPDGTSVRDFIHVVDLAEAHLLALEYLLQGGKSDVFNCGYGSGYSVKEVLELVKKITGKDFPVKEAPPRPGDPPILVADPSKIKTTLNWKPRYNDMEYIIRTAWKWEKRRESYGI